MVFASQVVKKNYDLYRDIIRVDSLSLMNLYKVTFVAFPGISSKGKNILLGLAYVDNETFETFQWVFSNFFEFKGKKSELVVTDRD